MFARALIAAALALGLAPAHADRRVALVIGNSSYVAAAALTNPKPDSDLVAETLTGDGFEVTLVQDAARAAMLKALRDFNEAADGADWALVFYAGHGIEIGGVNYLLPTDVALRSDRDAEDEAVSLDRVLKTVENARKLRLVILDSCRSNPFAAEMKRLLRTRSLDRGLSPPEPRAGVLVVYAAAAGEVAQDGAGEHSPFTAALARRLREPGLETRRLFDVVTADVLDATGGHQRPYLYGSNPVREELYFKPPEGGAPAAASAASAAEQAWGYLKASADVASLKAFRDSLPAGDPLRAQVEARIAEVGVRPAAGEQVAALPVAPQAAIAPKPEEPTECDRLAAQSEDLDLPKGYPSVAFETIDAKAAVLACEEALRFEPESRRLHFQLGRALDANKEYQKARIEYEHAAAAGSANAMFSLAVDYANGFSAPRDFEKSREWTARAATAGHARAMFNMGVIYSEGVGVPKNSAIGRDWLERAAAAGNTMAMNNLGVYYNKGYGAPRSVEKAREWWERAAASGSAMAMGSLGSLFYNGLGVPRDVGRAREWYEKAAQAGDVLSLYNLGLSYEGKNGAPADYAKAREWYGKAAAAGNADARKALARINRAIP